ncbi:nitroreductase family protein [Intrasporangium mesophilum]
MSREPSADEVLRTTRAVRRRLDVSRPVPRDLLEECLEIAMQAPSGSNRQDYVFVCVSDPGQRAAIADVYRRAYDNAGKVPIEYEAGDIRGPAQERLLATGQYFKEILGHVPWIVVAAIRRKRSADADSRELASLYGSVLPAFWSFMLAARARGLGTCFTTRHLAYEREAADILGIPYDEVTQVGMTPVAHYTGTTFKPAARLPLEEIVHYDRWDR